MYKKYKFDLKIENDLNFFFYFADDNNWNPIEWDRAAEELTWERVRTIFKKKIFNLFFQYISQKKLIELRLISLILFFIAIY